MDSNIITKVTEAFNQLSKKYDLNYTVDAIIMLGQSAFECDRGKGMIEYQPQPYYEQLKGNSQVGDGEKYKGRGFIQLTTRKNYTNFQNDTGNKVVDNPELLSQDPLIGLESLFWYFQNKKIFTKSNKLTIKLIERASSLVNRGQEPKEGDKNIANHLDIRINETKKIAQLFNVKIEE